MYQKNIYTHKHYVLNNACLLYDRRRGTELGSVKFDIRNQVRETSTHLDEIFPTMEMFTFVIYRRRGEETITATRFDIRSKECGMKK